MNLGLLVILYALIVFLAVAAGRLAKHFAPPAHVEAIMIAVGIGVSLLSLWLTSKLGATQSGGGHLSRPMKALWLFPMSCLLGLILVSILPISDSNKTIALLGATILIWALLGWRACANKER